MELNPILSGNQPLLSLTRRWPEKDFGPSMLRTIAAISENLKTGSVGQPGPVVDRALSKDETERRQRLEEFMDKADEDDLTAKVSFH